MAQECAFDKGFNSGFQICVDEREPLRGTPLPGIVGPRRRLRPIGLEGRGLIAVLGRGELDIGRGLAGNGRIKVEATERFARSLEFGRFIVQATAVLGVEQPAAGAGVTELAASTGLVSHEANVEAAVDVPRTLAMGRVATHAALSGEGEALVSVLLLGGLRASVGYAGRGTLALTAVGAASLSQALEGWVDLDWSARGEVAADDEETALALLGLPGEVVL